MYIIVLIHDINQVVCYVAGEKGAFSCINPVDLVAVTEWYASLVWCGWIISVIYVLNFEFWI